MEIGLRLADVLGKRRAEEREEILYSLLERCKNF